MVEVAPNADPPVCRLMDYGKFLYATSEEKTAKRERIRKSSKFMRFVCNRTPTIIMLNVKTNQARQWLEDGDKVKFTVRFRGRQLAHTDIGVDMLKDLAESLRDVSVTEQLPQMVGRSQSLVLAPSPETLKRSSERNSQSNAPRPAPVVPETPAPAGPEAVEG